MTMPIRLATAAVIGVLAVGGALYLDPTRKTRGRRPGPDARCERQPEPGRGDVHADPDRDAHPDA